MTFQTTDIIGDIVAARPGLARVFERYRIDYCCGGQRPLAEACAERGVDADEVRAQLEAAASTATSGPSPAEMSLTALVAHIEATHHVYLRSEMPRLQQLTSKIASVHGEHDARLHDVRDVVIDLSAELESHMRKEEQVLFPMVRQLESADGPVAFHCGSLANPIRQMESEHDEVASALERLRALTDDYTVPEWGCNTYRATLAALTELEADLHAHVHKENNVLFPRAIAVEASRR